MNDYQMDDIGFEPGLDEKLSDFRFWLSTQRKARQISEKEQMKHNYFMNNKTNSMDP